MHNKCPYCHRFVELALGSSCPGCGQLLTLSIWENTRSEIGPQGPLFLSPHYYEPAKRSLGWVLFSFRGRIPRGTYWMVFFGNIVGFATAFFLLFQLFLFIGGSIEEAAEPDEFDVVGMTGALLWFFVFFATILTGIWISLAGRCWHGDQPNARVGPVPWHFCCVPAACSRSSESARFWSS